MRTKGHAAAAAVCALGQRTHLSLQGEEAPGVSTNFTSAGSNSEDCSKQQKRTSALFCFSRPSMRAVSKARSE